MKKNMLFIVLAMLCLFFKVRAQNSPPPSAAQTITGKITDEQGLALQGATVQVENTKTVIITDKDGAFKLNPPLPNGQLLISFIGYQKAQIPYDLSRNVALSVQLKPEANSLNEVQVIGYGTTTKRLNTGSVSTVTAEEIDKQPIINILSAVSGRAPGVFVQTTNGLPGGGVSIQIRGKGSITAGTDPLYIIDGVPYSSNILNANNAIGSTALSGLISPFNSINPADIENISILKDADATAIYGSRGANGVILITTKRGKTGKTKTDISFSEGLNTIANQPSLLNLQQYLQVRREAFKNDGKVPSADPTSTSYAPDLMVWDTTQSTNWAKYMLGGTGHVTDVQGTVSGGNANTTFNIGGNYHAETTVLPGDNLYQRGGIRYSIQHHDLNNKFYIGLSGAYTTDNNSMVNPSSTLRNDIMLPPDMPLLDANGNINWTYGINPLAETKDRSTVNTDNLLTNLVLKYNLTKELNLSTSVGYNKINIDQVQTFPKASQNPKNSPSNFSYFAKNSNRSVIVEPQLNYTKQFSASTLNILAGGTYQNTLSQGLFINASNFSSEELLNNLASAGTITTISNSYLQYKYVSAFARVNYNLDDKYLINVSIRRDGSSRFGPGNQFGTFGAAGAAWIFSKETWLEKQLPWLSYGKIRGSYGIVGNDQITDYQYLSTYASSGYTYQDTSGLKPSRISNSDFHWEVDKKLEMGIELGFIQDRILLTVNRYQTRSSNQLVAYAIPTLTGFSSYQANLPAVVENTGWEFELNTKNIQNKYLAWTMAFNITLPKNTLKSFQNFANSSYANTLVIGEDITRIYGYRFVSLDQVTGKAIYAAQPGSTSTTPYFYYSMGKKTPDFYGGFGNTISYKNWQLDVFGQFVKQMAQGGITSSPGTFSNNYSVIQNRWQQAGDQTTVGRPSTVSDPYYSSSSANFFDASYFRLKNVALSYNISLSWLTRLKINKLKVYAEGQNLYTWWNSNTALLDPESGAYNSTTKNIPPVKSWVIGTQITF
ncbi:SusC/RagA family TonB-linked outer membrane protein [Mucilaginibacter sp. HMF5004]|uniref:SusC/RagA family TonB-linked outer membrane protein n=1 Tax=Mucilaginibacter rivuli TaxID=2857527 RepID=UPI001C5EE4CE|nr:SusC/RagA family TonB-linked outer membrane protein [Mucilaginibacter rivuli]MBW4888942.1 SusC/RagA family TonB-linked outer membrane protein [Mucilaginibacter rivuli]